MIKTVKDLMMMLRTGGHTGLGGYPLYFVTKDNRALAFDTVRSNALQYAREVRDGDSEAVVRCVVNWESSIYCDVTGEQIKSAYEIPYAV